MELLDKQSRITLPFCRTLIEQQQAYFVSVDQQTKCVYLYTQ